MASPDTARWHSYKLLHIYWSRLFVQIFVSWLIESHEKCYPGYTLPHFDYPRCNIVNDKWTGIEMTGCYKLFDYPNWRKIYSFHNSYPVFAAEPSFRVPEKNVTYIQGDTAILECTIHNLKDHKVIWTDMNGFLLTLNQKRIIEDVRISVERPTVKDWNLHIQNVNHTDEGRYICEINTEPVKTREVMLIVKVPPRIIDKLSTQASMTVREGETVTLTCNATGVPQPEIRWFRMSPLKKEREKIGSSGELLKIHNVSRDCGGTYICEAGNGYGRNKTRNMKIDVQYPPEVVLRSRKMGQYPGKETFLLCDVTAHPLGEFYWARGGDDLAHSHIEGKYNVEIYNTDNDQKKVLSLRVKNISVEDYGHYSCIAKNYFGEDKETMLLYDYSTRKTTTTSTTMKIPVVTLSPLPKNKVTYDVEVRNNGNTYKIHNRPESGNTEAVKGGNSCTTIRPFITSYLITAQFSLCIRYVLSIL